MNEPSKAPDPVGGNARHAAAGGGAAPRSAKIRAVLKPVPSVKMIYSKFNAGREARRAKAMAATASAEDSDRILFVKILAANLRTTEAAAVRAAARIILDINCDNETPEEIRRLDTLVKEINRRAGGNQPWESNRDLLFEICIALQINKLYPENAEDLFDYLGLDYARYSLWNEVLYRWCLTRNISFPEYIKLRKRISSQTNVENLKLDISDYGDTENTNSCIEEPDEDSNITDEIIRVFEPIICSDMGEHDFIEAIKEHVDKFHECSYNKHYVLFFKILDGALDRIYIEDLFSAADASAIKKAQEKLKNDYDWKAYCAGIRYKIKGYEQRLRSGDMLFADEQESYDSLKTLEKEIKSDFRPDDALEDSDPEPATVADKYRYLRKRIRKNPEIQAFMAEWNQLPFGGFNFNNFFKMYTLDKEIDRATVIVAAMSVGGVASQSSINSYLLQCKYPVLSKSRSFDKDVLTWVSATQSMSKS